MDANSAITAISRARGLGEGLIEIALGALGIRHGLIIRVLSFGRRGSVSFPGFRLRKFALRHVPGVPGGFLPVGFVNTGFGLLKVDLGLGLVSGIGLGLGFGFGVKLGELGGARASGAGRAPVMAREIGVHDGG